MAGTENFCTRFLFEEKKIRRYSSNIGAFTVPQFFSTRFHDDKNILSAIAALVIIVFFVPYTASGFAACGKLFNSLFGVDYTVAMVGSAIIIVLYTVTGGFKAVSTTDFIQSIVMSIALIAVLVYGITTAGGMDAVIANAKALPYFRYPLYKGDVPESGALASANSSSAQRGMIIVDSVIPELVKICHKEFGV